MWFRNVSAFRNWCLPYIDLVSSSMQEETEATSDVDEDDEEDLAMDAEDTEAPEAWDEAWHEPLGVWVHIMRWDTFLIVSKIEMIEDIAAMNGQDSSWKCQGAGIRQGCPLSPYLFCLVMGALFADLKQEPNTPRQQQPIHGIHFAVILYADDTLIFSANTHCINILHAIERHSAYFGLKLNYDKCEILPQTNCNPPFIAHPMVQHKVPRFHGKVLLHT